MVSFARYSLTSSFALPKNVKLTEIHTGYHVGNDRIDFLILIFADGTSKFLGWEESKSTKIDKLKLAKNEFLIGAEIEHGEFYVKGIRWLTRKQI